MVVTEERRRWGWQSGVRVGVGRAVFVIEWAEALDAEKVFFVNGSAKLLSLVTVEDDGLVRGEVDEAEFVLRIEFRAEGGLEGWRLGEGVGQLVWAG